MKIEYGGKEYPLINEDAILVDSIDRLLPLRLQLQRSANHEYYASLPEPVDTDKAEKMSYVKEGYAYYFDAWRAFSLNFRDMDI